MADENFEDDIFDDLYAVINSKSKSPATWDRRHMKELD